MRLSSKYIINLKNFETIKRFVRRLDNGMQKLDDSNNAIIERNTTRGDFHELTINENVSKRNPHAKTGPRCLQNDRPR